MIFLKRLNPGYLSFQGKMDTIEILIGPNSVMLSNFTNLDKNTLMAF
jgi:hypothetical protein